MEFRARNGCSWCLALFNLLLLMLKRRVHFPGALYHVTA